MQFKANPIYKPSNFQMDVWQVEKLVVLPASEFDTLVTMPMAEHPVIAANKGCMSSDGGTIHALLVLDEGRQDGVLVESEGYDYVRYGACVTGARDIVQARLDRAADFIIQQCIENPGGGSFHAYFNRRPGLGYCGVSFDELEERLGLTIRDGNGLDAMLLDTLRRRPEVSTVQLADGCVDTMCHLEVRKELDTQAKKVSAPLKKKRKAKLFDNAVSAICELFRGEDLYAMLHGSIGLTIQEIRAHGYMSDQELCDTCHVPVQMLDCDMKVRDVLQLDGVPSSAYLSLEDSQCPVPLEGVKALIDGHPEEFAALLDAQVVDIKVDYEDLELVLEGIEAQELERLHDMIEAHQQTLGPTM